MKPTIWNCRKILFQGQLGFKTVPVLAIDSEQARRMGKIALNAKAGVNILDAGDLRCAFTWGDTPQGHEFWNGAFKALGGGW